MKVLLWEYITQEWVEYPDMNSLGSIRWFEIIEIEFFWIDTDTHSFDSLVNIQYSNFNDALDSDAHNWNEVEDAEYVLSELKRQNLVTPENVNWVQFWVSFQHEEWNRLYEQRKAAREAEAVNA